MAGYEGSGSPTPSEHEDNDDKDEGNITEHEDEAQENDDTQADGTVNDGEPNESSPQDNNNYTNPGNEADGAQGLAESEDAEMAQPATVGSDSDIMAHDPDAGLDLEEQLGGMIIAVLDYDNGQIELLVMSIDSIPGTPEL